MRFEDLDFGWRSHLLATRFGGRHFERDDCIVIRMPDNPAYYWGNCIVLPAAPAPGSQAHWLARFAEEVSGARHVGIGVNACYGGEPLAGWHDLGFEFDEMEVLALEPPGLRPAARPRVAGVRIRPLVLPGEASLAVEVQCACNDAGFEPATYRAFRAAMMARISAMQAEGSAHWFGVFVGDVLAADCGLVHDGRLGRFQHVQTHPDWRRRGLCAALVHGVCRFGFDTLGLRQLAMGADPDDVAIGIYRGIGFRPVARHWWLQRRPPEDRA